MCAAFGFILGVAFPGFARASYLHEIASLLLYLLGILYTYVLVVGRGRAYTTRKENDTAFQKGQNENKLVGWNLCTCYKNAVATVVLLGFSILPLSGPQKQSRLGCPARRGYTAMGLRMEH